MHFCTNCENMYYIRLDSDDGHKLIYYCRKCGHEDTTITSENMCVSKEQIRRGEQRFSNMINEYTKLDPTLPKVQNVLCINDECISNKKSDDKVDPDIIYIRYDDTNKKFIYMCCHCESVWKTDSK